MPNISALVPKLKIKEILPNTTIEINDGEYKFRFVNDGKVATVTLEYIGSESSWSQVNIVNPDPEIILRDLVMWFQHELKDVTKHKKK